MSLVSSILALSKHPSVRSVGIYTFTNFFGKTISFLLLFIFTNPVYITPSENGLLSLFSTSMLCLMPFLTMGIIHSTSADYFKLDKKEFRDFFTTGFLLPFIVMILAMTGLYLFRQKMYAAYGFPYIFVWLIPVITFLTFVNEQLLSLIRNNNEPGNYLRANVFKIILELGISLIMVVLFAWRWEGRITGILVAYIAVGIYGVYYFISRKYLFGRIRKKYIKEELVYAIPIVALQLSLFCMGSSDKFFLSWFTNDNNETVGIYSIASIFGNIILVLCMAMLQYVFPKIYFRLSSNQIDFQNIRKHFILYVVVMFAGLLLIFLATPLAYHYFINEKYHPAMKYVFILGSGYFLWAVAYFFYSFLLYNKEKKKILALSLCCILISLVINYFFIRQWGMNGAAWANVTTYLLVLITTLAFTKPYWKKFFESPILHRT